MTHWLSLLTVFMALPMLGWGQAIGAIGGSMLNEKGAKSQANQASQSAEQIAQQQFEMAARYQQQQEQQQRDAIVGMGPSPFTTAGIPKPYQAGAGSPFMNFGGQGDPKQIGEYMAPANIPGNVGSSPGSTPGMTTLPIQTGMPTAGAGAGTGGGMPRIFGGAGGGAGAGGAGGGINTLSMLAKFLGNAGGGKAA